MTHVRDTHIFNDGPFNIMIEQTRGGNAVVFERTSQMRLLALFSIMAGRGYHRMQVKRHDFTPPDHIWDIGGTSQNNGPFNVAVKRHKNSMEEIGLFNFTQREVHRAIDKFVANAHEQMVIERNDDPIPKPMFDDPKTGRRH